MRRLVLLTASFCLCAHVTAQSKHRVVVDLFSGGRAAMMSTLGNIENLRKALAGQDLEVEIVAYGAGIDLVTSKDNTFAGRVKKLQKEGVQFATCRNTMHSRHISPEELLPAVRIVPAGIAEVVLKQEQGWSYLRR